MKGFSGIPVIFPATIPALVFCPTHCCCGSANMLYGTFDTVVPRRGSVTQARPRHPLHQQGVRRGCKVAKATTTTQHRMPFESWREARRCFACSGHQTKTARLREPFCLILVPRRGLEPPQCCHRQDLNLVRLPIPPSGHCFRARNLIVKGFCVNEKQEKKHP